MADFSQKSRLLAIDSPLGPDTLLLTRLVGEEKVSTLFGFEIEAYSLLKDIPPAQIVGKNVTLKISLTDDNALFQAGSYRYINGYVQSFRQDGNKLQDLQSYTAVVVPWFWFLTQTSDCKVFQFKTVKEIASAVFAENGFSDFSFRLAGQHPAREYCVQYKESDFDFLSRLFEEEGIYYYFEHSAGTHTLVISDHVGGYGQCDEAAVDYRSGTQTAHSVHGWNHRYEFRTGAYAKRDYDFKKPRNTLQTGENASMQVPGVGKYEHFVYPGRYEEKGVGDGWTRLRVESDEAHHDIVHGESGCRSFTPGHKFTLARHDDSPSEIAEYALLSVRHEAQDYSYTVDEEAEMQYENRFQCIPSATVYRPRMTTGWPKMQGPQNAMVVGPPGEEIYTDEYGRVKIQFPWDRYGSYDENSSCWVRVSHNWAGKNWGAIFLPRIGQEVIVDFMDGDPDRPLITGRVYNADQMPPWDLPANKTQSGILTRSTKEGTAANANWLRFEDKIGEEQVFLHAEKNQDIEVENDETHWVGHDRTKTIDNDETVFVHHDRTETVDNNETISIGVDRTETVGNNETIGIGVNRTETVGANETISIGANRTETVGANETVAVAANKTHTVGSNETTTISQNRMHTTLMAEVKSVGLARVHSVGLNETNTVGVAQQNNIGVKQSNTIGVSRDTSVGTSDNLEVGETLTISAGKMIKLVCGKSILQMDSEGNVFINGVKLNITGDSHIQLDSSRIDLN